MRDETKKLQKGGARAHSCGSFFDVITIIASDFIPSDRFTLNYRNLMLCLPYSSLLSTETQNKIQNKNTNGMKIE